ncbi:hypothetical protein EASAB2608_06266 [Streptomyces sp. EAS-AB2608]|uniref:hypothetical protein n=1 Tax=Streptomyces sp. EAS-AB2608 TaxID=2779671 RepID=UPI001BED56A6|nr:hypothetical protein [Streptomyces sp. EAS-AB2608]BCM70932.1 hypothetical protein EASAB2608_06266 [Streptomyces sp. EAS-AB2608]
MNTRLQFLKVLAGSFASGAVAALAVNAGWWLVTGDIPSLVTTLITSQIVTSGWGAAQALRFHRKWQQVIAAYDRPALGEGIEIPHRPPADEPAYFGHVVDYQAENSAPECVEDCPGCANEEAAR